MSVNYEGVNVYVTEDDFPTSLDAVSLLADANIIDPVTDENGNVYISDDGKIFIL